MIRSLRLLALPLAAAALVACSQMAALAPVGGDSITAVRNAVNDVLVTQGVDILRAPQCSSTASGFTCTGSTMNGSVILVEAGASAPFELTITIGDSVAFVGNAQDVLDQAVLEAS